MYTYGSALETGSPRFSSPGDFFTYVFFVAFVILVSLEDKYRLGRHPIEMTIILPQRFLISANLSFNPSIVTSRYLPAQPQTS